MAEYITERHSGATITMTALTTSGVALDFDGKDDKTAVIVANGTGSASNLTICAGTGIQGVTDIVVSIPANKTVVFRLDSGEFKQMSGTNKGKIVLKAAAASTLTATTVELCE